MTLSTLGALAYTNPNELKQKIFAALLEAKGNRTKAAEVLGTSRRNLFRIIGRAQLWKEIDAFNEKHNFPKIPAPARSDERIRNAVVACKGNIVRAAKQLDMKENTLRDRIRELKLEEELNSLLQSLGYKPIDLRK